MGTVADPEYDIRRETPIISEIDELYSAHAPKNFTVGKF